MPTKSDLCGSFTARKGLLRYMERMARREDTLEKGSGGGDQDQYEVS
jgi:hypothetical protein